MSVFTNKAVDIFSPVKADGTPRPVSNQEVQVWGTELERLIDSTLIAGGKLYSSRAQLDNDLSSPPHSSAIVMGDPIPSNNGIYMKVGSINSGQWQRIGDLPGYQIIFLTNTGSGTPNALSAYSTLPVPQASGGAILLLNVTASNTFDVSLTVNAEPVRSLLTNSGKQIAPGYIRPGMILALVRDGSVYRLLSDVASLAIQEAAETAKNNAEAAKVAAELARDQAQNAASDTVSQGNVPIYSTRNAVEGLEIPAGLSALRANGFATVGDGGAALYKRVTSEPAHAGKVRSADGAWWEINETVLRPEQFGAFSGGSQASVKAGFTGMKGVASAKGIKWKLDKHYDIGTDAPAVSVSNCITIPGAELTGNFYLGPVNGVEGSPIRVHFDNRVAGVGVFFDYVIDPHALAVPSQKDVFLTAADVFDAKYSVVDMSILETSYWFSSFGDTFVSETPATKAVDTISWALSGTTGRWHIAWVPVTGGDEVAGAFARDTFTRGLFIRTSSGFEYLYAWADAAAGVFSVKLEGAAPSSVVYNIPGASADIANRFQNAELSVRLKSPNSYSILANGYEIVPLRRTYTGDNIVAVGYGVFEDGTRTATLKNLVKSRKSEQHGLYPVRVGILGNSISGDNAFGRWDIWLRQYLDTSMGMRLTGTVNVAVSGAGTAGILAQSTLPEIANCNCVVIATPGTNDTQYNVAVSTSIANLTATIDNIVRTGKKCVMMIEPMWYIQSMVGGQGGPAQNHERGAELRTAIRRLCAVKGIPCVDMQQINGFTNPAYVSAQDVTDPLIRDNIHPSALGYKLLAVAAARAILQAYAPKPTREVKSAAIKATGAYSWLAAGWSAGSRTPAYSIAEDGRVTLNGIVSHSNDDSPAVVLTVPLNLRPTSNLDLMLSMFNGTTNIVVFGTLGVNGQLTVYGVPNAGQLRLDGVSWMIAA